MCYVGRRYVHAYLPVISTMHITCMVSITCISTCNNYNYIHITFACIVHVQYQFSFVQTPRKNLLLLIRYKLGSSSCSDNNATYLNPHVPYIKEFRLQRENIQTKKRKACRRKVIRQ